MQHNQLELLLEMVNGVTLRCVISVNPAVVNNVARLFVLQVASCAPRYLHTRQPRIVHSDLEDTNAFVETRHAGLHNFRVKLVDFGWSRRLTKHAKQLGGTVRWRAPVACKSRAVAPDTPAGVSSFGRVVYFVVAGMVPYCAMQHPEVFQIVTRGKARNLKWPRRCKLAERCRPLVEQCTQFDAVLRPNMREVHVSVLGLAGEFDIGDVLPSAGITYLTCVAQGARAMPRVYDPVQCTQCHSALTQFGPTRT